MKFETQDPALECEVRYVALRKLGIRTGFLFFNFFLIILVLYQLKPSSRSLFIEYVGASHLPYIWIATAVSMGIFIAIYHRLVAHFSRIHVVMGTCLVSCGLLTLFRVFLNLSSPLVAVSFFVFVDVLGVVLVEQFWSLTNSIYTTQEGKSWYGIVGTGGLVGGVIGGGFSALLIKHTPVQTPDLLLTAAIFILIIFGLTWIMGRIGIYCEVDTVSRTISASVGGWRKLTHSRYLMLIAAILLLAQLVSPIVEYQFLNTVASSYGEMEARTAFLSFFFSMMGLVSIGINIGITPLVHRVFGVITGLLIQPLAISIFSGFFLLRATLFFGGAAKISDRGLSYSINRASKELLYVPIDSLLIYQAKAWIDMFGYRLFKVSGSVLILLFTQWLPFRINIAQLSWFTINICALWVVLILVLRNEYQVVSKI